MKMATSINNWDGGLDRKEALWELISVNGHFGGVWLVAASDIVYPMPAAVYISN